MYIKYRTKNFRRVKRILTVISVAIVLFSVFYAVSMLKLPSPPPLPPLPVHSKPPYLPYPDQPSSAIDLQYIRPPVIAHLNASVPKNLVSGMPSGWGIWYVHPVGIADIGVDADGKAYYYLTSAFLGIMHVNNISTYNAQDGNAYSIQLNVFLIFGDGDKLYLYWVQNVMERYNSSSVILSADSNIWNMTGFIDSRWCGVNGTAISGNGSFAVYYSTSLYYSDMLYSYCYTYPYNVGLEVYSFVNSRGQPSVSFAYYTGGGWRIYDTVTFKFVHNLTFPPMFIVNGYQSWNAELVVGGFSDAHSTTNLNSSAFFQLQYWNGHNFQAVPNAVNYGIRTAEGIRDAHATLYASPTNGTLGVYITHGPNTVSSLYFLRDLSTLRVFPPVSSGFLYVNDTPYAFYGGLINLTLYPSTYPTPNGTHHGSYALRLYDTGGGIIWQGEATLTPGGTTDIHLQKITFDTTGLPAGIPWKIILGNITYEARTGQVTMAGLNGTYDYLIVPPRGYTVSPGYGTLTLSGSGAVVHLQFSQIQYRVVFSAPGLPPGSQWSVTLDNRTITSTNGTIVFVVTNGTYRWHVDLPPGYVTNRSNGNVSTNDTITTVTIYTTALPLGPYTYQILYGLAIGTAV
ncbi:MAG: thermopsin family protease, partial [Bacteroidales bacterium]